MLHIISTPIGNLSELAPRALDLLSSVHAVYCEDTRHSLVLLNHFQLKTKLISYQKFNERERTAEIIERLKMGESLALISDAGTPLISDPGSILIEGLIKHGLPFTHVSGACALISALVLSGLDTQRFYFAGFLPEKQKDKKALMNEIKHLSASLVFYVAVHDVERVLEYLHKELGARRYSLAREMTKKFEEVLRGTLGEQIAFTKKGEFVLVIEGKKRDEDTENIPILELFDSLLKQGLDKKSAMKETARLKNIPKNEVYRELIVNQFPNF